MHLQHPSSPTGVTPELLRGASTLLRGFLLFSQNPNNTTPRCFPHRQRDCVAARTAGPCGPRRAGAVVVERKGAIHPTRRRATTAGRRASGRRAEREETRSSLRRGKVRAEGLHASAWGRQWRASGEHGHPHHPRRHAKRASERQLTERHPANMAPRALLLLVLIFPRHRRSAAGSVLEPSCEQRRLAVAPPRAALQPELRDDGVARLEELEHDHNLQQTAGGRERVQKGGGLGGGVSARRGRADTPLPVVSKPLDPTPRGERARTRRWRGRAWPSTGQSARCARPCGGRSRQRSRCRP